MSHVSQERMILYFYGEDDQPEAVRAHLGECGACREEYRQLQSALSAADVLTVPQRDADYGREVFERIRPRLRRGVLDRLPSLPGFFRSAWVQAAAVGAVAVLAFLAGRHWDPQQLDVSGGPAAAQKGRETILLVAVGDHFERAGLLLVELANARGGESVGGNGYDISAEQLLAHEMIGSNRLYRRAALKSGEASIAEVLDQLERLLLDILHGPSKLSKDELSDIQERLDSGGLVFKIRFLGSKLEDRQLERARQLSRREL